MDGQTEERAQGRRKHAKTGGGGHDVPGALLGSKKGT